MREYYEYWQQLYKELKGMAKVSMSVALKRQNINA